MHPDARPTQFWVGGRLSFELVGIAGDLDARGVWTTRPTFDRGRRRIVRHGAGCSDRGHETKLKSSARKRDVLEFLKRL
jgi:hypothetical protein